MEDWTERVIMASMAIAMAGAAILMMLLVLVAFFSIVKSMVM